MLHRTVLSVAAAAALTSSAMAQVNADPAAAPAGVYEVEATHTSVCFTIVHMGLSDYPGCMTKISGSLGFDGKSPVNSKLDIAIELASVWTASEKLNEKLRKDFFKADVNKTATFRSSSAKVTGKNTGTITGDLTIGGVTKPVTLTARFNGGTTHPFRQKYVIGFDATGSFKRSDFGLDKVDWSPFVSDEVKLVIAAEFLAK
ncbi:MAG TPA: polyisoprenoid-binding protein [Alphaproteobacteria bacterium]|nr:polyisoprenoid-binding protein [Alphaproteobacteria bacterium]HAJ46312.1 polyisoprenoid-binding protein [Alphaproteobacteria bacterium]